MALEWYLSLGGVEIANSARLAAYLESVGSPLHTAPVCGCPTLSADLLDQEPYTTPEQDGAPWFDPAVPESADFAGLLVLSVDGLEDYPVVRTATGAVTGGAVLGPARVQPRTITLTGVLLGATCCAVEYGLAWLGRALAGCTGPHCPTCGGSGCAGADLTFYTCCPPAPGAGEAAARYRRTMRRVALTQGPTVLARRGEGCTGSGPCDVGADMITVEIVLTAGIPWAWTDPVPVLTVPVPTDDGTECLTWCVHGAPERPDPLCLETGDGPCPPGALPVEFGEGGACEGVQWPESDGTDPCQGPCRLAGCPDQDDACADPTCRIPTPPSPPPPATCYCTALAVNTAVYELDLTGRPRAAGAAPLITVEAGSADLRRVTITLYQRRPEHAGLTCQEVAAAERCHPHSVYEIAYVPAGGVLHIDGQTGRATITCAGMCATSQDAYGRGGAPLAVELLERGEYCVVVEADAIVPPAPEATVTIAVSGRGY